MISTLVIFILSNLINLYFCRHIQVLFFYNYHSEKMSNFSNLKEIKLMFLKEKYKS